MTNPIHFSDDFNESNVTPREADDTRSSEIMGRFSGCAKSEYVFGVFCFHSQWLQKEDNVPQNCFDGGPGFKGTSVVLPVRQFYLHLSIRRSNKVGGVDSLGTG